MTAAGGRSRARSWASCARCAGARAGAAARRRCRRTSTSPWSYERPRVPDRASLRARRARLRRREERAHPRLREPRRPDSDACSPICSTNVYNFWDRGLLGLALEPGFPTTPYVYVLYTHDAEIGGTRAALGLGRRPLGSAVPTRPAHGRRLRRASGRLSRLEAVGDVMTGSEQRPRRGLVPAVPDATRSATSRFGPTAPSTRAAATARTSARSTTASTATRSTPAAIRPSGVGGEQTVPTAEGGALRSQDLRTAGDPVDARGTIDPRRPGDGRGQARQPALARPRRRTPGGSWRTGLRNPFRFAFRPGTNERLDRRRRLGTTARRSIASRRPADGDGRELRLAVLSRDASRRAATTSLGLDLCEDLYADARRRTTPVYAYAHGEARSYPATACPLGGVVDRGAGVLRRRRATRPRYDGALFFADYSRGCIWAMKAGDDGAAAIPDSRTRSRPTRPDPVDLEIGPGGDLFYVDFDGGTVRRIQLRQRATAPPVAAAAGDAGLRHSAAGGRTSTRSGSTRSPTRRCAHLRLGSRRRRRLRRLRPGRGLARVHRRPASTTCAARHRPGRRVRHRHGARDAGRVAADRRDRCRRCAGRRLDGRRGGRLQRHGRRPEDGALASCGVHVVAGLLTALPVDVPRASDPGASTGS